MLVLPETHSPQDVRFSPLPPSLPLQATAPVVVGTALAPSPRRSEFRSPAQLWTQPCPYPALPSAICTAPSACLFLGQSSLRPPARLLPAAISPPLCARRPGPMHSFVKTYLKTRAGWSGQQELAAISSRGSAHISIVRDGIRRVMMIGSNQNRVCRQQVKFGGCKTGAVQGLELMYMIGTVGGPARRLLGQAEQLLQVDLILPVRPAGKAGSFQSTRAAHTMQHMRTHSSAGC